MKCVSKKIAFLFLILLGLFILQQPIRAQTAPTTDTQSSSLSIAASPENPQPGDTVTVTLSDSSVNLTSAQITWYVNGTATQEGVGQVTTTIQAQDAGNTTTVEAVAVSSNGTTIGQTSIDITPTDLDLITEPLSYAPPFYQGKPSFIDQGTVRFIAIPHVIENGTEVSPSDLVFKWEENGTVIASGVGQEAVDVTGSIPPEDMTILVDVFDMAGNELAEESKVISPTSPQIVFYDHDPLYGILFNEAIASDYYLGQQEELTVTAEPYSFSTNSDDDSSLNYQWSVNDNPVSTEGKSNELLLRQTDTSLQGTATVSLSLNSLSNIFQNTTGGFNIEFGE